MSIEFTFQPLSKWPRIIRTRERRHRPFKTTFEDTKLLLAGELWKLEAQNPSMRFT